MPKSSPLAGYLHFFWAGIVRHGQTGSFFPSQSCLVEKMIEPVPRDYRGQVLELGSGNGTLTVRLAARCPHARIVACELNPVLAKDTRSTLDRAGVDGQVQVRARPAQEVLAELTRRPNDCRYIISGLPIGNLSKQSVVELLHTAREVLPERGMFVQAQHFLVDLKNIKSVFRNVRIAPVLRNFPPVFVYYAQK